MDQKGERMTTILQCGEYRCANRTKNVNQFLDDRHWSEKQDPKSQPKATLRNLRCAVHAGAAKRSKYRNADILPLSDEDRTRLLAEQAAIDAEQEREAEERRKENAIKAEQRRRAEWAELDLPASYALVEDTDRSTSAQGEPVFEGLVWTGEEQPQRRYDNRWLQVEPSSKYYKAPPKGQEYPYIIRVQRGANLTPNEARALAALLIESADKAEGLNAGKAPA